MHDVVVALPRVPHRKAVVVSGCERDVARAGLLEDLGPGVGVEIMWIERIGRLGIFFSAKRSVLQIPLSLCEEGINAPMNEYAKTICCELPTVLEVFRTGLVVLCRQRCTGKAHQGNG